MLSQDYFFLINDLPKYYFGKNFFIVLNKTIMQSHVTCNLSELCKSF